MQVYRDGVHAPPDRASTALVNPINQTHWGSRSATPLPPSTL